MEMDRNINKDGKGKYALINLRTNQVQWGCVGDEDEFFVIKLKDRNAKAALMAYAATIHQQDPQFAAEVTEMAMRSGPDSPFCKDPD